jgi:23S rRNA pseudouridine1911/1915/1917 synthase
MNELAPTIIMENEHLLIIDKPSSLLVHPDGKRDEYSLVDWILKNRPGMAGVGEPLKMEYKGEDLIIDRPGIVHRLDRETSGVMILAKDQKNI